MSFLIPSSLPGTLNGLSLVASPLAAHGSLDLLGYPPSAATASTSQWTLLIDGHFLPPHPYFSPQFLFPLTKPEVSGNPEWLEEEISHPEEALPLVERRLEELLRMPAEAARWAHEDVYGAFPSVSFRGDWPKDHAFRIPLEKIAEVVRRFGSCPLLMIFDEGGSVAVYARQKKNGVAHLFQDVRRGHHTSAWDYLLESAREFEGSYVPVGVSPFATLTMSTGPLKDRMSNHLRRAREALEPFLPPNVELTETVAKEIAGRIEELPEERKVALIQNLLDAVRISQDRDLLAGLETVDFQLSSRVKNAGMVVISLSLPNREIVRESGFNRHLGPTGLMTAPLKEKRGNMRGLEHWLLPEASKALDKAVRDVENRNRRPSHQTLKELARWMHPHAAFYKTGKGTYEAMRRLKRGHVAVINPRLRESFPLPSQAGGMSAATFLLREIHPRPNLRRASEYVYGFSGLTGRSVDYAIDFIAPDGTRWFHLNAVGAGKTTKARTGDEGRDGILPLDGAWRRFYLSNLMHQVAGPLGFRTSIGAAIVDREKKRPKLDQRQATLYELRREQLRLDDLENAPDAAALVNFAKERIVRELGLTEMSNGDYVLWLARTLGEQFALMVFFGFDHGIDESMDNMLQLHPGNVSLAGEIFDFDKGRFSRNEEKIAKRYLSENAVSLKGMKKARWASFLSRLAPDIDLAKTVEEAWKAKAEALRSLRFDPREEIRKFNREFWKPLRDGQRS